MISELKLWTSVLSVTWVSRQHYTKCSGTVASTIFLYARACEVGHVVEVTHILLVTSRTYVTTEFTNTSKTARECDDKIPSLHIHEMSLLPGHVATPVVYPLQYALDTRMTLQ